MKVLDEVTLNSRFEKELKSLKKDYPYLKEYVFETLKNEWAEKEGDLEFKGEFIESLKNELY